MYSYNAANTFNMGYNWQYPNFGYNQFNSMPSFSYNFPTFTPTFNYNLPTYTPSLTSYPYNGYSNMSNSDSCTPTTPVSKNNNVQSQTATQPVKTENKKTEEKSGMPTWAKWTLGAIAVVGVCALAYFGLKGKGIIDSTPKLANKIDFKPASTVDEAIQFGKGNLGIKEYHGFGEKDLDAINWVNEGMVNASNKMQGKITMPGAVHYTREMPNDALAAVVTEIKGQSVFRKNDMLVNKNIFDNIDGCVAEKVKLMSDSGYIRVAKNGDVTALFRDMEEIRPLAEKIHKYNNGEIKTFKDKLGLYNNLCGCQDEINTIFTYPDRGIKAILNSEAKTILASKNIETNLDVINKYTLKQKQELYKKMMVELSADGVEINIKHQARTEFQTIYHELGHLQDKVVRPGTIYNYNNPSEYSQELKAWLNDSNAINTASRVSEYSTAGPGEFIAETYAGLIEGRKFPEEVMTLYKKLGGPILG